MLPLRHSPALHLNEGLAFLVAPLREFLVAALIRKHGVQWWGRCVEIQSEPVRERYGTETQVRANADPSFWIKTAEFYWDDCCVDRLGVAERSALSSLRHYRNVLCHDTSRLSARDVHEALQAIRLVTRAISPTAVHTLDAIILDFCIQHPSASL